MKVRISLVFAALIMPLSAGLVAHYPLDGDGQDSTPGAHGLTAYSANGTSLPEFRPGGGRLGGCARFDGQCLLNTTFLPVTGNADRTLMFFFRTLADNSPNGGTATAFMAGWGSPETGTRIRFDLGFQNNSNVQFRNEYNSGATTSTAGADPLNQGRWQHVAVVWTAADNTATYYLDGQPAGSAAAAGALNTGGGATDVGITLGADTRAAGVLTGASTQTPNRYFTGELDEVLVYDNALSASEVSAYFDGLQQSGPAILFLEADSAYSGVGEPRRLRYQFSTRVTAASLDQGIGSVLPVDAHGFGTMEVTPEETTDYLLSASRGAENASAGTRIEILTEPRLLSFGYSATSGTARFRYFLPKSQTGFLLQRSVDPPTGWPDLVTAFSASETSAVVEAIDPAAPAGRGFYRLARE